MADSEGQMRKDCLAFTTSGGCHKGKMAQPKICSDRFCLTALSLSKSDQQHHSDHSSTMSCCYAIPKNLVEDLFLPLLHLFVFIYFLLE